MQTLYNFLPFLFIKCLTFSKISWWNMMSLTTCTVWWNMMQNLIQNLNWNIAISLDTHRLMWFFFFPEENYSQEQTVPRRSGIAGEWHSPHINLFPIRTWEQFWCLGGFKISSNVTSPLTVSSIYSQKPEQNKTNNKTPQKTQRKPSIQFLLRQVKVETRINSNVWTLRQRAKAAKQSKQNYWHAG